MHSKRLYYTIRATGAHNVIVLGGLAYSNDFSGWVANLPSDPQHQIAGAYHLYGGNGCDSTCASNSILPILAAGYPVVIEELGEYDCAHSFVDTIMAWADAQNPKLGYMGWTWRANDCGVGTGMVTDMNGTPSAYGIGFKNHFAVTTP